MKLNPFSFVKNLLQGTRGRAPRPSGPMASSAVACPANGSGASAASQPDGAPGDLSIELPLGAILQMLPSHLQGRLRCSQVGSRTIAVPLSRILPQLAHGDVRISFGELRQAAPHLFSHGTDEDAAAVQLPLAEIVRRIDPALLLAPAQQPSPGQGELRLPLAPTNGERAGVRGSSKVPVARLQPEVASVPAMAVPLTAEPATPEPLVTPGVSPSPTLHAPAPLVVRLGVLAVSWPEGVRREIEQLHLAEAHVALPLDLMSQGLKRGRLAFSWQTLRAWIEPTPAPAVSAHGALELELPLKVVAPLFLARQREGNKPRARLEVASEIPDLFAPQPVAAACPPPAQNGARRPDPAPEAAKPAPPAAKPGAAAAAPSATPQQLVNRAAQLQGVEGALVALRDGLLVASRFPTHLNADNIAAFLPQIFSKLGQYTQELHMGDLNALEFLVGKVPWKVFRLNGVFFVAFGREGEPLPSAPLASLITELGQPQ